MHKDNAKLYDALKSKGVRSFFPSLPFSSHWGSLLLPSLLSPSPFALFNFLIVPSLIFPSLSFSLRCSALPFLLLLLLLLLLFSSLRLFPFLRFPFFFFPFPSRFSSASLSFLFASISFSPHHPFFHFAAVNILFSTLEAITIFLLLVSAILACSALRKWYDYKTSRRLSMYGWLACFLGPFLVSAVP